MNREKLIIAFEQIKVLAEQALQEINAKESREGVRRKGPQIHRQAEPSLREISFNTNVLAFMKKHASGLPGPKKLTLLLAHMTKGKTSQEVSFADLEKMWNKMKVILKGKFNGAYANRAKANG